jgi:hypothetical protein
MQPKENSNKTSVISAVIASACIIVYAAALVSALVRIYISIDQRRIVAEQEFYEIANLASSAGVLGFMDEPFIETINDSLARSSALEALIISGPNGEYAFERERGKAVNWVNNAPRFRNRFDFSTQSLFRPLQITGLRNVNIQAVAGAVDYQFLTGILKQTLLMILAALALSFFTLVMESLLGKNTGQRRDEYEYQNTETAGGYEPEYSETPPPVPPKPKNETAGEAAAPTATTAAASTTATMTPTPTAATVVMPAESPPSPVPSRGLYSPHNIGWEEDTVERLDSELCRCASTEQDLTFITMEFKRQRFPGESFYKQFAEDTVRFFFQRDLIFEKGERGVTVICPGADLEAAFEKCGDFHNHIMNKYPEIFKSKTDFCAGLSACTGRSIDAKRLMFEANEALGRALEDQASHIVAFKSDPDKYRAFMRRQGLSPA